jgi:AbiU2
MYPDQESALHMDHRKEAVKAFCEECVWARAVRTHFAQLFESGETRHRLMAEVAETFFHDLNVVLLEYVLLQQCKLTDPASSGAEKFNLTTNYILSLSWSDETRELLVSANRELLDFRAKVNDARRKLVAHSDLRSRLQLAALSKFTQADENEFWSALQRFVDVAHTEAYGGPFEIAAVMPDGDAASLIHSLIDAVDYNDLVKQESSFLTSRIGKKRYPDE